MFPFIVTGNLLTLNSQARGCYSNSPDFNLISAAGKVENEQEKGCRLVVGL